MCLGLSSRNDTEPSPPERALSSSLACAVCLLLRVGREQEPACSAGCGALLAAAGLQVPHGDRKVSHVCSWFCSTAALGWCELIKMKEKGWGNAKLPSAFGRALDEDGSWGKFSAAWKTAFPLKQALH